MKPSPSEPICPTPPPQLYYVGFVAFVTLDVLATSSDPMVAPSLRKIPILPLVSVPPAPYQPWHEVNGVTVGSKGRSSPLCH